MIDPFARMRPTSGQPLLGLSILLVEDSHVAGEAIRVMCLRSGARLRRASSLAAAERHLRAWAPRVVIVDIGLPDGSGTGLIRRLNGANPRVEALIGLSGDPEAEAAARAAGADGFLSKPLSSLAALQEGILACLPPEARPRGLRALDPAQVPMDEAALLSDLARAAALLDTPFDALTEEYIARFLAGVAATVGDRELGGAADNLRTPTPDARARLSGMLGERLSMRRAG